MKVKGKVFFSKDGNRFLIPKYIYDNDDDIPIGLDVDLMLFCIIVGIEVEEEWFEFDDENIPHVSGDIIGSMFLHGRATVAFISGPLFDAAEDE